MLYPIIYFLNAAEEHRVIVFAQGYAQAPASPPPGEPSVTISVVKPATRSMEADTGLTVDRSRLRKSHMAAVT